MGKKEITDWDCKLFTVNEVADLLSCDHLTVRKYCDEGYLPIVDLNKGRKQRRAIRIPAVAVEEFINMQTERQTKHQKEKLQLLKGRT